MDLFDKKMAKLLYVRFCTIYAHKFVQAHHDENFIDIWCGDWMEGLKGISFANIKEALQKCAQSYEWPPSLAEFRKLCLRSDGIPSLNASFLLAVERKFEHPVISAAFQKVGSWAFKNDRDEILRRKFKEAYIEAVEEYSENPEKLKLLSDSFCSTFSDYAPLPSPPPEISQLKRIDTTQNIKEILNKKYFCDGEPKFTKNFDPTLRDEEEENRKKYLLSLSDAEANSLSAPEKYDRLRLLQEIDSSKYVEKLNKRPFQDVKKVYKPKEKFRYGKDDI